jgi:acyl-CoA reductase-like NAD-dependent aldehyde dehydrogenase
MEPDAQVFPAHSPLDGSPLADVQPSDPAAVKDIVRRARRAQRAWAETPTVDRARTLAGLKSRILSRADEIADVVRRECGKPTEEALLAEVLPNADLVDYWAVSIEELMAPTPLELDPISFPGKTAQTVLEPRGVVGLITPWNYPIAIPLRTILPALAAGNAVVFKPSEITARSGALVASLFDGLLPEGVFTLVQGGADVGQALVTGGVDVVVFTGSVATGRRIAVACAEQLIPCSLELGGKDAAIVFDDADVERTARGLVWGAFTNAGQSCASIERVYAHEKVAAKLTNRIVELTQELRPGRDTAVLTTSRQAAIVRRHVGEAVEGGAEILAGALPDDEERLDIPPIVVRVQDDDCALMKEETFGPVLPIFAVESVDEAVDRVNRSAFGLTTSLWTRRYPEAHEVVKKLKSGVVTINNHGFTAAIPQAPWTGTGDSGFGVTNGPHALAELTRPRFVLEDRNRAKSELWWYPYTPALRSVARAMVDVRGGSGIGGRLSGVVRLVSSLPKRLFGG